MALAEAEATEGQQPPGKAEFFAGIREQGVAALRAGQFQEAADKFREVADQFKGDMWFRYDYGKALTEVGGRKNVNRAIGLLEQAQSQNMQSEELSEWVPVALAEAYGRAGRYDDARKKYLKARELNPDNTEANFLGVADEQKNAKAQELHDQARSAWQEGDTTRALRTYEKTIILVGEEQASWSLHDKGCILLETGHTSEAVEVLETVAEILPDNTWAQSSLGRAYETMSNRSKELAEEAYTRALQNDDTNSHAQQGMERLTQAKQQERGSKGGKAVHDGGEDNGDKSSLKEKASEVFTAAKETIKDHLRREH